MNAGRAFTNIKSKTALFSDKVPIDFIAISCILIVHFACMRYLQNFMFSNASGIRWFPIIISTTPVIFTYHIIRFVAPPLLTGVVLSEILIVLSLANRVKASLTNEPISWSDLTTINNISIVWRYITICYSVILIVFILIAIGAIYIKQPTSKNRVKSLIPHFMICLTTIPVAFSPYVITYESKIQLWAAQTARKLDVGYITWDWSRNIKTNGLPLHLVQTSTRKFPASASDPERIQFEELSANNFGNPTRPKHIIFILGESFWHDKENFAEIFSPLKECGFEQLRAVAHAYGGGTANVSFEILTGLPARGKALNGTIFQEYKSQIAENAHTLPQYLRGKGYLTVAAHNNSRKFWQRHIIKPKFGFDRFIAIEDMDGIAGNTDDSILYETALKVIKERKDQPLFLDLVTMHTHGPYKLSNDFGEGDYTKRLSVSMSRLVDFVNKVKTISPDALILIYGDHKPSLTRYFYEKKIIPADQFDAIGSKNEEFRFSFNYSRELTGDVPVYVRHTDKERVKQFASHANGLPFFRLIQTLDEEFIHSGTPAFEYSRIHITPNCKNKTYKEVVSEYPDWLYSLSIFESIKMIN